MAPLITNKPGQEHKQAVSPQRVRRSTGAAPSGAAVLAEWAAPERADPGRWKGCQQRTQWTGGGGLEVWLKGQEGQWTRGAEEHQQDQPPQEPASVSRLMGL